MRIRSKSAHDAADYHRRIESCVTQDCRDHRGRGCFSVRTGDGHGVRLQSHQFREHLGTRNHWDRASIRFDDLRIVIADGGRAYDDVWVSDVLSSVTFKDLDTHLLQALGNVRVLQIRAGDTEPEIDEHLSDARHADATDTYKMDVLNSSKHLLATKRHKKHKLRTEFFNHIDGGGGGIAMR